MERFLPTDNNYCTLGAVSMRYTSFQRWLSALARRERTLKIRLKRRITAADCNTGDIHVTLLKKHIAAHARTRRKIAILSRRLRTDQGLHPFSAVHIMRVCSQTPAGVNIRLPPSNGIHTAFISRH